jgi:hypothetical protein
VPCHIAQFNPGGTGAGASFAKFSPAGNHTRIVFKVPIAPFRHHSASLC